jgi:hypothetical protein
MRTIGLSKTILVTPVVDTSAYASGDQKCAAAI